MKSCGGPGMKKKMAKGGKVQKLAMGGKAKNLKGFPNAKPGIKKK